MTGTGEELAVGGLCTVHMPRTARNVTELPRPELPRVGRFPAVQPGQPALERLGPTSELIGYRGPTACAAAGITYRQLDYWARTGLLAPSVRSTFPATGQRLYSFRDILLLKIVKRLLDAGVSLQNIRVAVAHLQSVEVCDLTGLTLMCDGATVYECTTPQQVVDLLKSGQGVFGIAVGAVWQELERTLGRLHAERTDTGETVAGHDPADELAQRRNRAV
ncbi:MULTISPECIES: MerR family transcriptional regulator [unclassified Streptomyces]|uniref:MerR family transcriptional regulator n=1 Tax=Streptomycetaceae TaxID=2062 RepID=UPI002E78C5E1|nr:MULTISPECIES: MerR family transcriptional regulator [unclassified Streptomyces]MED7951407.1 MerR family transcriptional regulator [Streptomyces sp. BE303]MEE1822562.1 MerR family transcriptional regulator [Streptomyces sp. BE20]